MACDCIAMFSGTPARIRFRAVERRRSCTRTASKPAALHAAAHVPRKSPMAFPSRWNTNGQSSRRASRARAITSASSPTSGSSRPRLFRGAPSFYDFELHLIERRWELRSSRPLGRPLPRDDRARVVPTV